MDSIISDEVIINKIFYVRNKKIMLDKDLAELYGVTTGNFNKAVQRNLKRFPLDFMFQLNDDEFKNLIFHFGISSWGGTRKLPYCFTEQGVAMLSSVLNSDRAIEMNICIIRIFTKLRDSILANKDVLLKLEQVERKLMAHDEELEIIFKYLKELLNPNPQNIQPIGYKPNKNQ